MFKVNIKYISLLIISIIFVYAQGENLPYVSLYLIGIPFLLSIVFILLVPLVIGVNSLSSKKNYRCGDIEFFDFAINNKSFFMIPYLSIKNIGIENIKKDYGGNLVTLSLKEEKVISEEVHFYRRGIYGFGSYYITLKDLFGIFKITFKKEDSLSVRVYPKIYEIDEKFLNGFDINNTIRTLKSSSEDPQSTKDMRRYRDGDSLKRINWKVSAKLNELYVRNLDYVNGNEFNIFLDMHCDNYSLDPDGIYEESLIDFCASLAHHFYKKEFNTNILVNNKNSAKFSISNQHDYDKFMDYLVENKSNGISSIANFIKYERTNIPSNCPVALLTAELHKSLVDFILYNFEKWSNVAVYYLRTAVSKEDISKLESMGVPLRCILSTEVVN